MKRLLVFCLILSQSVFAQHELLQSGPMLGYSGFRGYGIGSNDGRPQLK